MRAWHRLGLTVASTVAMWACDGSDGEAGSSCTVEQEDAGRATITCDDGTGAVVEPREGQNGSDGKDGANGSDGEDGADGAPGADGDDGIDGANGSDGAPGTNGSDGAPGAPGMNAVGAGVIGPGLKVEISSVSIPSDLRPVVSLSIKDGSGHALDRTGATTPGAVSVSFVLASLSSEGGVVGQYVPYTTSSVAGKTIMGSAGTYTYRFVTVLPTDYDTTKTHTLAVYSSRTFEGVQYAADPRFHFRPDAEPVSELREIVTTDTCNHCHDSLRVHGGSRFELGLCVACHVDGMNDPESGNSLDFKQMVHKIHRGANLPSVKAGTDYRLVGYGDDVHDYSDVVFPQAMENCTTCHRGGADSDRWKTHMTRDACTSCHDRTNFAATTPPGFVDHTAGEVTDDTLCSGCHHEGRAHIGPYEVDVTRVHVPREQYPLRDANGDVISEAPVVTGSIVSVTGVQSGQTPVVTFRVQVDGQPYDILASGQALSRLSFTFAAPTRDYGGYAQYTAQAPSGTVGTLAASGTPGELTWTASQTIDNIASAVGGATGSNPFPLTGTMAVGMEGRLTRAATTPRGVQLPAVNYAMRNDVYYVALTDAQAVSRRAATEVEKCNTCHADLVAHGGTRNDPEYCVMCHTAGRDTITRMGAPSAGNLARTTTLRMSYMVHRIHTGEDGSRPYVAFAPLSGMNANPIDFGLVRFPGDRRNCEHCHLPGQFDLPLPTGLLPSRTSDIDSTRTRIDDYHAGATGAACAGCHDSESAEVHAATMSIFSAGNPPLVAESCASCHANGKEFGLDRVHARPGP
jgi:OmcA/MtrC family decaheme c-type cytochrome